MYEKNLKIGYLLDFYGDILSERKRSVLDMYYNEDLSLAEIAGEIGISRQGVRELIKKAEEELIFFEDKLGLSTKMSSLSDKADKLICMSRELNSPSELYDALVELKQEIEQ